MSATTIAATAPRDHASAQLSSLDRSSERSEASQAARPTKQQSLFSPPERRIFGDVGSKETRNLMLILATAEHAEQGLHGRGDVAGLLVTYDHEGPRDTEVALHGHVISAVTFESREARNFESLPLSTGTLSAYRNRLRLIVTHSSPRRSFQVVAEDPVLRDVPWSCSRTDVDWTRFGVADTRLSAILARAGLQTDLSRPRDICRGILTVLTADTWARPADPPFAHLLARCATRRVRVDVAGPTYAHRDALKARGYRWSDGRGHIPRGWFVYVPCSSAVQEVAWVNWRLGPDGVVATMTAGAR